MAQQEHGTIQGYKGYVAQEFIPTNPRPLSSNPLGISTPSGKGWLKPLMN